MSAIDEKGRNKMLIIKGILAEKCGLTPELYDELGRELDELMMIVDRNKSEGEKKPDTESKCNKHIVIKSEAAVCPKCGNTDVCWYLDGGRLISCNSCCWIGQTAL